MSHVALATRLPWLLALGCLAACQSFAPLPPPRTELPARSAPVPAHAPTQPTASAALEEPAAPPNLAEIPDAIPEPVTPTKRGNPDSYVVGGQRYEVQKSPSSNGFYESGRASWYGKQFHGRKTANGETFDMHAMTAAHKTLRLPSYLKVTNLANGRSCVVKVNDRGPFIKGRIIDLSFAAATKIDMIKTGHADVVIEAVVPDKDSENGYQVVSAGPRYLEIPVDSDPITAADQRDALTRLELPADEILERPNAQGNALEQVLRVGPFESYAMLEIARLKLKRNGFEAGTSID